MEEKRILDSIWGSHSIGNYVQRVQRVYDVKRQRRNCGVSGVIGWTPTSLPSKPFWFFWFYGYIGHPFHIPPLCGNGDSKADKLTVEHAVFGDVNVV